MTGYSIVFVTAPAGEEGANLAKAIVEARLAACVNVIPGVESHFFWEGQVQKNAEVLLVIKTRTGLIPQLTGFVREKHSYKVPEVVAFDLSAGSQPYLDWLGANTQFARV